LDGEGVVREAFLNPFLDALRWDKVNVKKQLLGHGDFQLLYIFGPFVFVSLPSILVAGR